MRLLWAGSALFLLALVAAIAPGVATAAEPAKDEAIPAGSPFGPGWDPLRAAPVAPTTVGRGIVSARLVVAGPADVEELRADQPGGKPPFYGVVIDVVVAAASTTPVLGRETVFAKTAQGHAQPLVAACTPTMEDSSLVWQGEGALLRGWHVAIGDKTWFCGGMTGRLAIRVGKGGLRLSSKAASEWRGPLILLFAVEAEAPRCISLPGAKLNLPVARPPGKTPEDATKREAPAPARRSEDAARPGKAGAKSH